MGLIAAKCTQCGANIEVDGAKEAGICKFRGTTFVTEKAIYNYNVTTSVVNIYNEAKSDDFEIDNRILILYKGSDEVVSIPEYITEIGQDAFRDNKKGDSTRFRNSSIRQGIFKL